MADAKPVAAIIGGMWMKSSAYWRKRFELLEQRQLQKGIDAYHEIAKQYDLAIRDMEKEILTWYNRFATENKITLSEAKKLLAGRDLEAFRMDVKSYIEKGQSLDPQWAKQLEQASVRVHVSRLESLKVAMQQMSEKLHSGELDTLDKVARDIYTDGYYRTAFEVAKGSGVSATFAALDTAKIDKVISKPWAADGREFSARIWGKRTKLVNELHTLLTQNIIKGESPDKLIKQIAKRFDVSKANAGRLIMTESAYFSSAAQHDSFKEVGVEKYEIVATLDDRTSDICQEMDGKVFKMSEWEVGVTAPVFHANCRTTTVPYFADLGGERAMRDENGKYKTVPENMTYKEWKENFIVD
ncbi:MAG: minor capsid protein [Alphaproteobacteria bacterium]|nr:minor capsid protein [Alphaproteobacteria bacterium]